MSRAGVTLLEMIVTIVIIAMVLGLSVVVFRSSNRDLGVRAAANHCVALVRSVSEHARAQRIPSWIVLDLGEPSIHTLTEETIQAWNFEDDRGAFGQRATTKGVRIVPGREGLAYQFGRSSAVQGAEVPVAAPDQGIGLEFWLYRLPGRGRQTVCTMGRQVEVVIDGTGRLTATVCGVAMDSKDAVLPMGAWVHVRAMHSGFEGRLFVNGVQVDARRGRTAWAQAERLIIGAEKDGFVGIVDSFRIGLIIARDKYFLPRETRFVLPSGTPQADDQFVIGFTPEGRLDPARHPGPVSFTVKSPADEKTITISPLGVVVR
ncbi:MAG: prepilin-type N-terminal cleavage/methylation domain-containing protein [Planctomycetes bacterium]|nr:prepilin-type N-terminal cleavage/methylation domain-containing protein [Planctomycetota bacterium]